MVLIKVYAQELQLVIINYTDIQELVMEMVIFHTEKVCSRVLRLMY